MTRTSEGLAAFVVDQLEELYRRMGCCDCSIWRWSSCASKA